MNAKQRTKNKTKKQKKKTEIAANYDNNIMRARTSFFYFRVIYERNCLFTGDAVSQKRVLFCVHIASGSFFGLVWFGVARIECIANFDAHAISSSSAIVGNSIRIRAAQLHDCYHYRIITVLLCRL